MLILAFESSCDDTSVALLRDSELISMYTHTQGEHEKTSGVVPEVAARLHADHVFPLIDAVLKESGIRIEDVDMFACTKEPGLVPSLLVGKTVAKMFAQMYGKPLVWVNHIEAHVFSVFLDRSRNDIHFPAVVLSASGGHNDLFYWKSLNELERIGGTRDDSAGESMDKVGREMGLPFPSGPYMDKAATKWQNKKGEIKNEKSVSDRLFPIPLLEKDSLDFSFSGLKSAALREIQERIQNGEFRIENGEKLAEEDINEICFEYRESICLVLLEKIQRAMKQYDTEQLYLVGGVSANARLRELLDEKEKQGDMHYLTPALLTYCGDNAAMVGITAYYQNSTK